MDEQNTEDDIKYSPLDRVIRFFLENKLVTFLLVVILVGWGLVVAPFDWEMGGVPRDPVPVDAIPDLSDVQVIVLTEWPGRSPDLVEDQVTYPLTSSLLAAPKVQFVRGQSFMGLSFVYVIFEDGTDLYWARSRVLEYLNFVSGRLPRGVTPSLGPDATGVGWVYNYALVDRTGQHDLAQLRSLQDWFLKYELQTVAGVSEVATVGGMVKQYQVVVDPDALRAYGIPLDRVRSAVQRGNREVGGSVIEMAEAEYMIRATGYLQSVQDLQAIPLGMSPNGTPIRLGDVAEVRLGPQMRRGIADLDGEGEVVGGVVVMRWGENALATIDGVKARLAELERSLPDGVEIVTTYDRSSLIQRAIDTLTTKLIEEMLVVAAICVVFLLHLRSALVAIVSLPIGILAAFVVMYHQGINANIMSLGGIAIAIGAMVDAAIVMIENAHKHLERYRQNYGHAPKGQEHWVVITAAAAEVGPALFFSLLIITLSFLPVFTLEAQEGRLFAPLAFTKTYAMAASAGLAVTLVPVLMGYFIRGHIPSERSNPLSRLLIWLYRPLLNGVMRWPRLTLFSSLLLVASIVIPIGGIIGFLAPLKRPVQLMETVTGQPQPAIQQIDTTQRDWAKQWRSTFSDLPWLARFADGLGSEFMPELYEGDLMYMPTTLPGISVTKAKELLQQTDKIIAAHPQVAHVLGKVGRAATATDPAAQAARWRPARSTTPTPRPWRPRSRNRMPPPPRSRAARRRCQQASAAWRTASASCARGKPYFWPRSVAWGLVKP